MAWNPPRYPAGTHKRCTSFDVAFTCGHSLHAFFTNPASRLCNSRRQACTTHTGLTWTKALSRQAHLMKAYDTDLESTEGIPRSADALFQAETEVDVTHSRLSPIAPDAAESSPSPAEGVDLPSIATPSPKKSGPISIEPPISRTRSMIEASQPTRSAPSSSPRKPVRRSDPFGEKNDFDSQPSLEDNQWANSANRMRKKPRTSSSKRSVATIETALRTQRAEELQQLQRKVEEGNNAENSDEDALADGGDDDESTLENPQGSNTAPFSLSERLRQEGHVAEASGEHGLATQLYWRSVQLDAQNGKAWQNLAKSEGRRKRSMRASAAVLRRALGSNPRNAYLWQSLGFLLFRMRQYEDARSHFQTGISRDPNHAPLYSTWAHLEFALKNYARARELYETGSAIVDGGARVFHNWGQMELKLGNETRARELFDKGLELEPFNAYIWETLGSLARKEDDFETAKQCYLNALQSEENNVVVLEAWAKLEVAMGNPDEAREIFQRGADADIRDFRILHSWSVFEFQSKDYKKARKLIEKAVLMCPTDSFLWTHFARIEASLQDYPRARAMFNRACEINARDWRAWDAWSAMEHSLGNMQQAEKLLRESFRIRFDAKGDFTILANSINDRFG